MVGNMKSINVKRMSNREKKKKQNYERTQISSEKLRISTFETLPSFPWQ
jgi:hypothetical protein